MEMTKATMMEVAEATFVTTANTAEFQSLFYMRRLTDAIDWANKCGLSTLDNSKSHFGISAPVIWIWASIYAPTQKLRESLQIIVDTGGLTRETMLTFASTHPSRDNAAAWHQMCFQLASPQSLGGKSNHFTLLAEIAPGIITSLPYFLSYPDLNDHIPLFLTTTTHIHNRDFK